MRALVVILVLLAGSAFAQQADNRPEPQLADPVLEARAREISRNIRCLVCQNQSIEDSNADLARDLRTIVRERVVAGDGREQVEAFLVARYGDWVLLKPPLKGRTVALWLGPAALLAAGARAIAFYFRRRGKARALPAPLNAAETERLRRLLGPKGQP